MSFSRDLQHSRNLLVRGTAVADQPVAFTDQEIPNVQGDRNAVLAVQRHIAVPEIVGILNVVMDKGGLVETLRGNGNPLYQFRHCGVVCTGQRLENTRGEQGAPSFAGPAQP